jgi:hypothetical protein
MVNPMTKMYVWKIPWYGGTSDLVVLAENIVVAKSNAKRMLLNSKLINDTSAMTKQIETKSPTIYADGYVGVW